MNNPEEKLSLEEEKGNLINECSRLTREIIEQDARCAWQIEEYKGKIVKETNSQDLMMYLWALGAIANALAGNAFTFFLSLAMVIFCYVVKEILIDNFKDTIKTFRRIQYENEGTIKDLGTLSLRVISEEKEI